MNEQPIPLSAEGQLRRERILLLAQREARRRRRWRRMVRTAGVCGVAAAVMLTGICLHRGGAPDQRPGASAGNGPGGVPTPTAGTIVIERIQTDPAITSRLAIPPQARSWQRLSDDELLDRLAEAGKPAGIAYLDGRAVLLFHTRPQR